MKRTLIVFGGAVLVMGVTMLPSVTSAQGQKQMFTAQPQRRGVERHPKIRQAVTALEAAKFELEHADTDFGGHKREAIESVDNALKQLRLAIQFDKQ